jgi:hypothetical protein
MSSYPNSWSGSRQFYKGSRKSSKKYTAETDTDYLAYCKHKKNKSKIMSYASWCKAERKKRGMF